MYTYIIEEDDYNDKLQYGVTIYNDGEMLSSFTGWFNDYNQAYDYSQEAINNLSKGIWK